MERLIIDIDPGIDDAAALFFALASPEVSIDLITTVFGNVTVEQATVNAQRLLAFVSRGDIPVRRGAAKPLRGSPNLAMHIHGSDGLGDVHWPQLDTASAEDRAVEAILEHVHHLPGAITVVGLGPLTNIALALLSDPSLANRVKRVICMGGAVLTMGNASPVASANFYNDPLAAAIVYESGAPIVQIGLDVCQKVYVTEEQLGHLEREGGPAAGRLMEMSRFIKNAYQRVSPASKRWSRYGAGPWVHFNDVPAVGYTVVPEIFTSEHLPVVIETQGVCRGQTVVDFRNQLGKDANATVALDVDGLRLAELFVERVAALGRT
jgi:pyrimidine-specific ribonucleoside hydrolase